MIYVIIANSIDCDNVVSELKDSYAAGSAGVESQPEDLVLACMQIFSWKQSVA